MASLWPRILISVPGGSLVSLVIFPMSRATALSQRVGANLDVPPGTQKVEDIETELASAQSTMAAATDRHKQTKATLADMLQQIEGVPPEQVAAKILALQTSLQASLQTTSLLHKMSLVNYI